ncbi:MAG: DUF433 domain-containing protein, partial [Chloroflexi bacterium]|nr:DUF433 domain-containing protein [Chloroflexota bacterium]
MRRNDLVQRFVSDTQRCGGRPCINGTRIEVSIILDAPRSTAWGWRRRYRRGLWDQNAVVGRWRGRHE